MKTEVGHPREGTRQTVREGLNVVWVKEPSAPNHYIIYEWQLCQSSVQVLTNFWYSHTSSFVTL